MARNNNEKDDASSLSLKYQYETVDVYLMAPLEEREIELKDFTIMKPKNNKMHRLIKAFPGCEIQYQAQPPAPTVYEERQVTSPNGTVTTIQTPASTTQRHNGGFSNPSRNTEIFRLKRRLLREYNRSLMRKGGEYGPGEVHTNEDYSSDELVMENSDVGDDRNEAWSRKLNCSSKDASRHRRNTSMKPYYAPRYYPKYERPVVGDEETIPLTSDMVPKMSLDERLAYINSLWPEDPPMEPDDEEAIMDYYQLAVTIISPEEEELETKKLAKVNNTSTVEAAEEQVVKGEILPSTEGSEINNNIIEEEDDVPEMTVETRSMKNESLKSPESPEISAIATKQDDWVQCDKCQKWRRLPNHVNVSELPSIWYCKMNRWDRRHNKCSIPEEKTVVLVKDSDLFEYRARQFAHDLLQRMKRMEKSVLQYKYTDPRDDDGQRKYLQCAICFKKRPLIAGMDPMKVHRSNKPFVCWMNSWDDLHASCSAPQSVLLPRIEDKSNDSHALDGKDRGYSTSAANGTSSSNVNGSSGLNDLKSKMKRKHAASSESTSGKYSSNINNSSSANSNSTNSKRPKRR